VLARIDFIGVDRRRRSEMAMRLRRRSRHALIALTAMAAVALVPVGPASAHVHGITPLRCVGSDNDGADQTDETPAAAENDGSVTGLIPRDVGSAPLTVGDAGFDTPACSAP
jgi:hypothetical protein